jgi:hypothetical protein
MTMDVRELKESVCQVFRETELDLRLDCHRNYWFLFKIKRVIWDDNGLWFHHDNGRFLAHYDNQEFEVKGEICNIWRSPHFPPWCPKSCKPWKYRRHLQLWLDTHLLSREATWKISEPLLCDYLLLDIVKYLLKPFLL